MSNIREGDWICSSCRNHNYASRTVCNVPTCALPKPAVGALDASIHASVAVPQPGGTRGDPANWFCPMCNNENFPSRAQCNKKDCNFPRFQGMMQQGVAGAHQHQLQQQQHQHQLQQHQHQQQQQQQQIAQQQAMLMAQQQQQQQQQQAASLMGMQQYAVPMNAVTQAPTPVSGNGQGINNGKMLFNPRPGDWLCPMCNNHNYASREVCNGPGCEQRKPLVAHAIIQASGIVPGMVHAGGIHGAAMGGCANPAGQRRVGDWVCPLCNNLNYASREVCNGPGCQQAKSMSMRWLCPQCNNDNYAHREKCNKSDCQFPKPANPELVNDRYDVPAACGGKKRSMRGDPENWTCELCGNENFPTRVVCNIPTCRNPRDSQSAAKKMRMDASVAMQHALAGSVGGLV